MKTNVILKFLVIGVVLLSIVSIGEYFSFSKKIEILNNKVEVKNVEAKELNAIYNLLGNFSSRLKNVPDCSDESVALQIKEEDPGIRLVNGVRNFHVMFGLDVPIFRTSDGKHETIAISDYEAIYIEEAPGWAASRILEKMKEATLTLVDSNLKQFVTDAFYQKVKKDPRIIPGYLDKGPYPENIEVDSIQKLDDNSYLLKGDLRMTGNGVSYVRVISLTVKSINNNVWLVDDLTVEDFPTQQR